jgi:hypothetical protein
MLFVLGTLLVIALVVSLRHRPRQGWLSMGQSQKSWELVGYWDRGSRTGRELDWDEPPPGESMPQVYQLRRTQYGPLVVMTRRRVPPLPGEVAP